MVGIVIVSHSATLAEGVAELAREMGGDEVAIVPAGGLDEPDRPLGTDAALVVAAVERADGGDGVLVLMDLGSAVLSAEMALDMLDRREHPAVRLCSAPIVEGAVSAAAAARQGLGLELVEREARRGLVPKQDHLGDGASTPETAFEAAEAGGEEIRLAISNPLGLHARPAARFVSTAAGYDARVSVTNATTGRGPANARSLSAVATLGARRGHEIVVRATGPAASEVLAALRALAEEGFGDAGAPAPAPPPVVKRPETTRGGLGRTAEQTRGEARLAGVATSPGIAVGPAGLYRRPEPAVPDPTGRAPEVEWSRLEEALGAVRRELDAGRAAVVTRMGVEAGAILEAQAMLLEDEEVLGAARRAIFDDGANAERAFARAADAVAAAYDELDDDYQRARAADVRDVRRRVLVALVGGETAPSYDADVVLVADDLAPADVAALDATRVMGIVTARGGATSHAAILARAAGIPAVVGVGEAILEVADGTTVIVDGTAGAVLVAPDDDVVSEFRKRRKAEEESERRARAAAGEPARTRDGAVVEIMANASSGTEAARAVAAGADGIGLLRTEFLFLGRSRAPTEEEQYEAYVAVVRAARGRPVVLRTLDVGGDKPLPFVQQPAEVNPWLGVRGLRLGLSEPGLLRTQLRAALRAAAHGSVKIMFPMVTTTEELKRARALLIEAGTGLEADVEVGIMVEVPAVALAAARFVPHADFFSIGTNDLAQYTMAAERGNERLASLTDGLAPALLRLVQLVCDAAEASGRPVAVCGELAADPVAIPVLLGLGVRELSVNVAAIPRVKQTARSVDVSEARALAAAALEAETAAEVRTAVSGLPERNDGSTGSVAHG